MVRPSIITPRNIPTGNKAVVPIANPVFRHIGVSGIGLLAVGLKACGFSVDRVIGILVQLSFIGLLHGLLDYRSVSQPLCILAFRPPPLARITGV